MPRSLGLLAVAAMTLFPFGTSQALASHVQCGDVITQDTTLDGDLVCTGDGLTISGADVTLDLAGYAILGSDGSGTAVRATTGSVEVHGGSIINFDAAVESDGPDTLLVHDMVIEGNGVGVSCSYTPECSVLDSNLRYQRSAGIRMHAPDSGGSGAVERNQIFNNGVGVSLAQYRVPITSNRIEENEGVGVEIDYTSEVEMSRNHVVLNGGDGVVVSFLSVATIANNQIESNGANGVRVDGDFFFGNTAATVRDNRIEGNYDDGVRVTNAEGASGTVIERNRADHNADDGIDVDLGQNEPSEVDILVRRNKAFFNADLGIEAAPGTTDGGGNKARHNGNPAQCVGVRCK